MYLRRYIWQAVKQLEANLQVTDPPTCRILLNELRKLGVACRGTWPHRSPQPNQPIFNYMLNVPLFCIIVICSNLKYDALVSAFSLNAVLNAIQSLSCYNPIHRKEFLKYI